MNTSVISSELLSTVLSGLKQKCLTVKTDQGNAVVNYTERDVPYTRVIEHKHFEFGTQDKTVISREYSSEWSVGMEPYYPVNDEKKQCSVPPV